MKRALLVAWAVSPLLLAVWLLGPRFFGPAGAWVPRGSYWSLARFADLPDVAGAGTFRSSFSQAGECSRLNQGLSRISSVEQGRKQQEPALWVDLSDSTLTTQILAIRSRYFGPDTADLPKSWYFSASDDDTNGPVFELNSLPECEGIILRVLPASSEYVRQSVIAELRFPISSRRE